MDLYEVMRTAATARSFSPEPVPDEVLHRVFDHARFAPSGGNRQGWRVVVVRDAGLRRTMRDLYLGPWRAYTAQTAAGQVGFSTTPRAEPVPPDPTRERRMARADAFAEHLDEVPVHLLVLVDLRALAVSDAGLPRQSIVGGGSVYPFVQNVLLALRNEGLAGALTTLIVPAEPRVKELLSIPDEFAVAALVAVGYPDEPLPTRLRRKPVEEFATVDSFAGPPLAPAP